MQGADEGGRLPCRAAHTCCTQPANTSQPASSSHDVSQRSETTTHTHATVRMTFDARCLLPCAFAQPATNASACRRSGTRTATANIQPPTTFLPGTAALPAALAGALARLARMRASRIWSFESRVSAALVRAFIPAICLPNGSSLSSESTSITILMPFGFAAMQLDSAYTPASSDSFARTSSPPRSTSSSISRPKFGKPSAPWPLASACFNPCFKSIHSAPASCASRGKHAA
eukprot:3319167-Rhodomonas_salina.4